MTAGSVIPAQAGTAAGSVIPAQAGTAGERRQERRRGPSFLRRQEPAHARTPSPPSSPIHPSPLLGGRLGGGCGAPSGCQRSSTPPAATPRIASTATPRIAPTAAARIAQPPQRASPQPPQRAPPPTAIPAPPLVIPAQAGMGGAVPACAGMTVERAAGGRSWPPTPHLTSPLKGGRDEFSWGSGLVRVGCVRWGARVPACAGMTEREWQE